MFGPREIVMVILVLGLFLGKQAIIQYDRVKAGRRYLQNKRMKESKIRNNAE